MKQVLSDESATEIENLTVSAFGYELIREDVLTDLLGKNASQLLYWAGKNLARKHPLHSVEDIISFFEKAGWGSLTVDRIKKNEMEFHLTGELVAVRMKKKEEHSFQLEAGFLAQQIQQQTDQLTESYEQHKKRAFQVIFTVKWDKA
ncbi:YslB family protein [Litchfieldia salsa]|uniref:Predicted hydrocarbon binding protein, contains 4VR domain n=1 Tax=Litchfieldia salsa TaxID=930152 RepID=A0A1H0NXL0_9BACI|nr:YslB family protein [Litchfieldia salsa]SDO97517.1 Predicted hydrocarbon binding protein, contains 4VR domain [Litchfieldia salsa]